MLKVYNTLTKQKEEFKPLKEGQVSIYVCGVTPYNHPHIGNARPFVTWDVIKRYFTHLGYKVKHIQNFTDVDDKIIRTANQEGVNWSDISTRYINSYFEVMDKLHVKHADIYPKVSQTIPEIIDMISVLIDKGYAYELNGDVYFSVEKFKGYGKLSGRKLEDMMAGARIEVNESKHNPMDFALWKAAKPGEPFWESPWGNGRPGWHIECSTMSLKYLGKTFDFHGGGSDLIFPHHENEIAQSMAYNGHPIANYWMHNQMINIDGEKMSKSLGNVLWAKDLIVEFGCNVFKWLMLSTHYRNPLNMTDDVIAGVRKEVSKAENATKSASLYLQVNHVPAHDYKKETVDAMVNALEDDLNTSLALTQILDQVKVLNQVMRVREKDNDVIATEYATLVKMGDVLGFLFEGTKLSEEDIALYEEWNAYKKEKNFDEADRVRKELTERGIL